MSDTHTPFVTTPDLLTPLDPAYQQLVQDHEQVERRRNLRFGFRIGSRGFLVPRGLPSEVVNVPTLYPMPRMPASMLGLMNLRGDVVPVFDLSDVVPPQAGGPNRRFLLVLGQGMRAAGLLIDGLPVTLDKLIEGGGLEDCPASLRDFVREAMQTGGQTWYELECEALFRWLANTA